MEAMTVLGPVAPDALGITSMHEHIIADCSFSGNDQNKKYDDVDEMVVEMGYFLEAGGRTIVEQTSRGLGQNAPALREISRRSGVQIIASTGFYRECVYPPFVYQETVDQIAARMIDDIQNGVEGSDVRAGIIAEIATEFNEPGISPAMEKIFRASARASLATGVAISTHCWRGHLALEQIKVFREEGVRSDRILIGHLAVAPGLFDLVLRIAETGVYLGVDAIGYSTDEWVDTDRADEVRALIDHGFLTRITLSQDMMRHSFLKSAGGFGYCHLLNDFLPLLRERGVTEDQIRLMLVDTPRRLLSGEGA